MSVASNPVLPTEHRASDPTSGPLDYLSASRLRCWGECRLKFRFRYVDRLPSKASPALHIGKAVHKGLQAWNLARWRGEPADPKTIRPAFVEYWETSQTGEDIEWKKDDEVTQRDKAWGLIEHYIEQSDIPSDEKPEGVEVLVERDFEAHGLPPLKGVIDLVRPGGRIVDFKTAARTPDLSMVGHLNGIQRVAYAVLYREATGRNEASVEFHHLLKTKAPKLVVATLEPVTPEHCRDFVRLIKSYVEGIHREDFVPSPGLHCSYCDFREKCATRA